MKKSFLFLLLALVSSTALYAYNVKIDGIYYNFSGNEAYVTYYRPDDGNEDTNYSCYSGSVVIPQEITYFDRVRWGYITRPVTGIGEAAFFACHNLTSVTIPSSVTYIGDEAFYNCSGLTSVTIPNGVTSIGNKAFGLCSGLTSINVDTGNTKYDSRNGCNAIIETATNTLIAGCQNTIIPNSVTSIGDYAFVLCSSLTSITIPHFHFSLLITHFSFEYFRLYSSVLQYRPLTSSNTICPRFSQLRSVDSPSPVFPCAWRIW